MLKSSTSKRYGSFFLSRYTQFIAYDINTTPVGFLELSLRHDYVNGTNTSPVAFIEGIYTVPSMRKQGVATLLMKESEKWAKEKHSKEIASDALSENIDSHKTLKALDFAETECVIYFCKVL